MPDNKSNKKFMSDENIAIIGISCRFPGAKNYEQFWHNLSNGRESISFFSKKELEEVGVRSNYLKDPNYVRARGIIEEADYFDASFFGLTSKDAKIIDPQHRIFLECAWHSFEDAGYDPGQLDGKVGVFAGAGTTWHLFDVYNNALISEFVSDASVVINNDKDYIASRVSYLLNLTGASVNVQAACSTSSVAVILGANSLLNYQNDLVLAGGVSIHIPEKRGYIYQHGGIFSSDGHCRTFDSKAQGAVFSSGVGVVLLKRLSDAIEDNDNIYAVIKGSAINNDGSCKRSYAAPSVQGQVAVEVEALKSSGVNAETISYVEAHGTATQSGDIVEIEAITQAFRTHTLKKQYCAVGSVKTNIGHTDTASGVAGLIKTILSIKNKQIPPTLHFESPNPKIDFVNSPFYVNTKLLDWKAEKFPLRAMVNSFGIGGTNACLIVEEVDREASQPSLRPYKLFLLSAKTDTALDQMIVNLKNYVEENQEIDLDDASYTLQVGRRGFDNKCFVICKNTNELLSELNNVKTKIKSSIAPPVIFMFPGQGNQYVNMGFELYQTETLFRKIIDDCCELLETELGFNLKGILYPDLGYTKSNIVNLGIDSNIVAQPSLFIVEYALAKTLMSWGIEPHTMIGYSVGEYVASCLSGVLSLKDSLKIIVKRAKIMEQLPKGLMIAVPMSKDDLSSMVKLPLEFAAINSPKQSIISGPVDDIVHLEKKLQSIKVSTKRLPVDNAFHSKIMEPIFKDLAEVFVNIKLNKPNIPFISTVTGKPILDAEATDSNYWITHLRQTVLFSNAVSTLLDKQKMFLEIGPGNSLYSAVKAHLKPSHECLVFYSLQNSSIQQSDQKSLTTILGYLWNYGVNISWYKYYSKEIRHKVPLPGYPLQRRQHTIKTSHTYYEEVNNHSLKKNKNLEKWFSVPSWKRGASLDVMSDSFIKQNSCWIVFLDEFGIGDKIVSQLINNNCHVITIINGNTFKKIGEYDFVVNPLEQEHYDIIFDRVKLITKSSLSILYLWSLSETEENYLDTNDIEQKEIINFYVPLLLEQKLIKKGFLKNLCINFITNNLFDVIGERTSHPIKALITGPTKVFAEEYSNVNCKCIDITIPKNSSELQDVVKQLIFEISETNSLIIAYRNNYRWLQIFEPTKLVPLENNSNKLLLRKNGVYLITGGLGGLGLVVARFLLQTTQAKLILVYKSYLPERDQWDIWMNEHAQNDDISKKIRTIIELEKVSGDIMLCQGDVTNFDSMETVIKEALKRFNKINGVFHAAGIAGSGIIPLKTKEMASKVINPKVKGVLVLDSLLKEKNLDFFMLFSSISSILGVPGQIDYCSANAFMDSFAHFRTNNGHGLTVSVNWGIWKEVGMAVNERQNNSTFINKNKLSTLITFIEKDKDYEIYRVNLDYSDWVISDHKLSAVPTLVGTAFFNVLNEIAKLKDKKSYGYYTFKNVKFVAPAMYHSKNEKVLNLFLKKVGNSYDFVFKSSAKDFQNNKLDGQDHLKGKIVYSVVSPTTKRKNVDLIINRIRNANSYTGFFKSESISQQPDILQLGPRWSNTLLDVYKANNECLACIELSEKFCSDLKRFPLHPALLDIATTFCIKYFVERDYYLPHAYEKFTAYGALTKKIYSHVDNINVAYQSKIISFDVEILNDIGELLVKIEGFKLKKLSKNSLLKYNDNLSKNLKDSQQKIFLNTLQNNQMFNQIGISPNEGTKVLKTIFSSKLIPQVIVSPFDFKSILKRQASPQETLYKEDIRDVSESSLNENNGNLDKIPTDGIEKSVASLWQSLLGVEKVGMNDTLLDLGGDSLTAVQMVASIIELYQVNITIDFFDKNTTVAKISEVIKNQIQKIEKN